MHQLSDAFAYQNKKKLGKIENFFAKLKENRRFRCQILKSQMCRCMAQKAHVPLFPAISWIPALAASSPTTYLLLLNICLSHQKNIQLHNKTQTRICKILSLRHFLFYQSQTPSKNSFRYCDASLEDANLIELTGIFKNLLFH